MDYRKIQICQPYDEFWTIPIFTDAYNKQESNSIDHNNNALVI